MKSQNNQILIRSLKEDITTAKFEQSLLSLGIEREDVVMVHSSVFSLGKLGEIHNKKDFSNILINSFFNIIGEKGTLIFPTFTFSFCKSGLFDIDNSSSEMGVLSESARKREDSIRTNNPIYSVCVLGYLKEKFLKVSKSTCFGKGSIFEFLHELNHSEGALNKVKFVTIGVKYPPEALTFVHYLEEKMRVPYRYYKTFHGHIINKDNKKEVNIEFYVRDLEADVIFDHESCWELWNQEKINQTVPLGDSFIAMIKERDFHDTIIQKIKFEPDFLCVGGYKT